jgi:hypothetical protein
MATMLKLLLHQSDVSASLWNISEGSMSKRRLKNASAVTFCD